MYSYATSADDLPWLYRVKLPRSATHYDTSTGFTAQSRRSFSRYAHVDFTKAVEEHLDWRSRVPSPFISVFGDEEKARRWALGRASSNRDGTIQVCKINPYDVDEDTYVFKVEELVSLLNIDVPAQARVEKEYLILHKVPAKAIMDFKDVQATIGNALVVRQQDTQVVQTNQFMEVMDRMAGMMLDQAERYEARIQRLEERVERAEGGRRRNRRAVRAQPPAPPSRFEEYYSDSD